MPQYRPRELTPQEARERGIEPRFTITMVDPEDLNPIIELMELAGIEQGGTYTAAGPFTFDQVWALMALSRREDVRVDVWPRGWIP
ncbi:hypothetical protein [Nocardia camponoti]|uniref:Uncharacterized protein n=1 Tax=Nocardia camponoti TaxID=1616106 RepID=A0A917QUM4_9NOCA|nr:hypothetical protein [Nocardia camponoti]GGK68918.1 hypothetical protein GCM10011591_46290 [Nocardia camponoti]